MYFSATVANSILVENHVAVSIKDPGAKGVQNGVQCDVAFKRRRKSQSAGNAELLAHFFCRRPAGCRSAPAPGHANRPPVVLKEVHRRRNPEIGEGEICLVLGIERGPMRKLLDGAVLASHRLIDLAMVNYVLAEFGGWPGKDEHIVSLAGLHLGEGAVTNFLHRNNVNGRLWYRFACPSPGPARRQTTGHTQAENGPIWRS